MRLGLIGLGRIGAFHANTLAGVPTIDSLVVTDIDRSKVRTWSIAPESRASTHCRTSSPPVSTVSS